MNASDTQECTPALLWSSFLPTVLWALSAGLYDHYVMETDMLYKPTQPGEVKKVEQVSIWYVTPQAILIHASTPRDFRWRYIVWAFMPAFVWLWLMRWRRPGQSFGLTRQHALYKQNGLF